MNERKYGRQIQFKMALYFKHMFYAKSPSLTLLGSLKYKLAVISILFAGGHGLFNILATLQRMICFPNYNNERDVFNGGHRK